MASAHVNEGLPSRNAPHDNPEKRPQSPAKIDSHPIQRQRSRSPSGLIDPSTLPSAKLGEPDVHDKAVFDLSEVESEGSAVLVGHPAASKSEGKTIATKDGPDDVLDDIKGKNAAEQQPQILSQDLDDALLQEEKDLPELPSDDPAARPSSRRLSKTHSQQQIRSSSHSAYGSLPWPFNTSSNALKPASKPMDAHKLKAILHKRDREIEILQEKLENVSERYAQLHDRFRTLESDLRVAQAGAFNNIPKAQWAAEDDGWVSNHFSKLETHLKTWSRDYAIDKLSALNTLDGQNRNFVESLIRTVCQYGKERFLPPMPQKLDKKAAAYILLALVSDFVFRKIIGDVFYFLEDHLDAGEAEKPEPSVLWQAQERQSARGVLNCVYSTAAKVNPKEASEWRFKTLQLLDPRPTAEPSRDNALHQKIMAIRKEASLRFAMVFRSTAARALLRRMDKEEQNKCFHELGSLFKYAGELSYKLWSQGRELRVLGLPELRERRFAIRSELLEAHALHKLDDDEDETLDGCPIMAVISPSVVAFGDANGNDADRGKILIKATVWLDEFWSAQSSRHN